MERGERHNGVLPPAKTVKLSDPARRSRWRNVPRHYNLLERYLKSWCKGVILVRVLYDDGETDTDLDLTIENFRGRRIQQPRRRRGWLRYEL